MNALRAYIHKSLEVLAERPEIRRATTFVSPKVTVKVTRQRRTRANAKQQTFLLSVGSPNFLERRFLKSRKERKFPLPKYEVFTRT
jgi:hypothetical protein